MTDKNKTTATEEKGCGCGRRKEKLESYYKWIKGRLVKVRVNPDK